MQHLRMIVAAAAVAFCLPVAAQSAEDAKPSTKEPAASAEAAAPSPGHPYADSTWYGEYRREYTADSAFTRRNDCGRADDLHWLDRAGGIT